MAMEGAMSAEKSVQQVHLGGLAYSILWKTLPFNIAECIYVKAKCTKY